MNIFKQFFKSLYSPKDIALFRFQGIGKTILYVFCLTLISLIPTLYFFSTATSHGIEAIQESLEAELPPFEIIDGQLHSNEKAPIILTKEDVKIVFDSTGTVKEADLGTNSNTIALLKNEAYFIAAGQSQVLQYSMFDSLSSDNLLEYIEVVDNSLLVIIPLISIMFYIFSAGLKFIEISLFALLALLLKKLLVRKLEYRHTWRIAAYSVTLPTVFFTIMAALQTEVPNGAIINAFVTIIILYLVIKEIPQPKKKA